MSSASTPSSAGPSVDRWASIGVSLSTDPVSNLSSRFESTAVSPGPGTSGGGVDMLPDGTASCSESGVNSRPAVLCGKSVIVLTSDSSSVGLCLSPSGKQKTACLSRDSACQIAAHVKHRASGLYRPALAPGIYVKFSTSEDEMRVRLEPCGALDLLTHHEEEVLTLEGSPSDWAKRFNDWSREDAGLDTVSREFVQQAKAMQTPAKRLPRSSFGAVADAVEDIPDDIDASDLKNGMSLYDAMWSATADASALLLPDFALGDLLLGAFRSSARLGKAVESLHHEQVESSTWAETNVQLLSRRITDLEIGTGDAPPNLGLGSTLWGSLSELAIISDSKADSSVLIKSQEGTVAQFEAMFNAVQTLEQSLLSSSRVIRDLERRLGEAEEQLVLGSGDVGGAGQGGPQGDLATLMAEVTALKLQRESDRARIELLESQGDIGSLRVEVRPGGPSLRSAKDVANYLQSIGASDAGFGGFVDIYNLLYRIQTCIEGGPSITEVNKNTKDVLQLAMNEDEAIVGYTFRSPVPSYFGGKKTEKTYIPKLPDYSKWRTSDLQYGFAVDAETYVYQVRDNVRTMIRLAYEDFPELLVLAMRVFESAITFLSSLIRYVDETYANLKAGGNSAQDVWQLMTKVIRALFEEGVAPHRSTPVGNTFSSPQHKASVLIWGVLRTFSTTESIMTRGIKEHPVVMATYPQWLVHNSGKKDAAEAKLSISKLEQELTRVKEGYAKKQLVSALEHRLEQIKTTADKALSRASGSGGSSSSGRASGSGGSSSSSNRT